MLDDMEIDEGVGRGPARKSSMSWESNSPIFSVGNLRLLTYQARPLRSTATVTRVSSWEGETAVTDDALFITPGFGERLSESDADILDGVVLIDLEIAVGLDVEVDEAVTGEEVSM